MFIISAGLQKSGSAWIYQITDDLLQKTGHTPARELKVRYGLEGVLKRHNCVIPQLTPKALALFDKLAQREGAFVVKTHSSPPALLGEMMAQPKGPKSTLIYRDPRDVAISALEHGQRQRNLGHDHLPFAQIRTLPEALFACRHWLRHVYLPWANLRGGFCVAYEMLLEDTLNVTRSLAHYLEVDASDDLIQSVIDPLQAAEIKPGSAEASRLHLNKAKAHRYRALMTEEEQALAVKVLGPWIELMGYDPRIQSTGDPMGVSAHIQAMTALPTSDEATPLAKSA